MSMVFCLRYVAVAGTAEQRAVFVGNGAGHKQCTSHYDLPSLRLSEICMLNRPSIDSSGINTFYRAQLLHRLGSSELQW